MSALTSSECYLQLINSVVTHNLGEFTNTLKLVIKQYYRGRREDEISSHEMIVLFHLILTRKDEKLLYVFLSELSATSQNAFNSLINIIEDDYRSMFSIIGNAKYMADITMLFGEFTQSNIKYKNKILNAFANKCVIRCNYELMIEYFKELLSLDIDKELLLTFIEYYKVNSTSDNGIKLLTEFQTNINKKNIPIDINEQFKIAINNNDTRTVHELLDNSSEEISIDTLEEFLMNRHSTIDINKLLDYMSFPSTNKAVKLYISKKLKN